MTEGIVKKTQAAKTFAACVILNKGNGELHRSPHKKSSVKRETYFAKAQRNAAEPHRSPLRKLSAKSEIFLGKRRWLFKKAVVSRRDVHKSDRKKTNVFCADSPRRSRTAVPEES